MFATMNLLKREIKRIFRFVYFAVPSIEKRIRKLIIEDSFCNSFKWKSIKNYSNPIIVFVHV